MQWVITPAVVLSHLLLFLPAQLVQAEVVMFTVVFVLLTLLVNAPMLPLILRWTRLNVVPPQVCQAAQGTAVLRTIGA